MCGERRILSDVEVDAAQAATTSFVAGGAVRGPARANKGSGGRNGGREHGWSGGKVEASARGAVSAAFVDWKPK